MEVDKINEYIDNIGDDELFTNFKNIKIIICKKNNLGTQRIISLGRQLSNLLFQIKITYVKDYKFSKINIYEYSLFGGLKNTLYNIIQNQLVNMTETNSVDKYYLSHSFNFNIPIIEESEIITVDKRNIIESYNNNSCIVCYESYNEDKVEYKLRCNHSICRECFFNIIVHGSYKCPMCRKIMI